MQTITGQIVLALRMFAVCEKYARKRVGRNNCALISGQSLPADHEYANGVGVDTPCGEVSTRELIVIVSALLEL